MKKYLPFFTSLKGQMIVGVILLQTAVMGIFVYDFLEREYRFMQERTLQELQSLNELVASNAALPLLSGDLVALKELVSQISTRPDTERIYILDHTFRVRSSNDGSHINDLFSDPRSLEMEKQLRMGGERRSQRVHDGVIDTLTAIRVADQTIGYVRIISSTETIHKQIRTLEHYALFYLAIVITGGALIAWIVVGRMTRTLSTLSEAASEISKGNFGVYLPLFEGKDEISKMGRAFRTMIASIRSQMGELESMLVKVRETEAIEHERNLNGERYQKALLQTYKIGYDDPKSAIDNAVETCARTLGIERVGIWLVASDGSAIECHEVFTLSGGLQSCTLRLDRREAPRYFETIFKGEIASSSDVANDPMSGALAESYFNPNNIVSILDIPFSHEGRVLGILSCEHVGEKREWKSEEKEFALAIGSALALAFEIDRRKKAEMSLDYQAHHDLLTHLSNRPLFLDRLEHAIRKAKRNGTKLAVMFIDLDRFKEINDSLGHQVGDQVLIAVAERLREKLREVDTIARLGGDEFTLIIEDITERLRVGEIAQKLIGVLQQPMDIGDYHLYVTSSVGISFFPEDGEDSQTLLRNADSAMYKAKESGRNSFHFYTQELTEQAYEKIAIETSLRQALENGEFVVYYQPQMDAMREKLIGMEALVRWNHPQKGMVPPAKFIPAAEETGLILAIDDWVMRTAMRQFVAWYEQGLEPGVLSLNLAVKQLWNERCVESIRLMIQESGCKSKWIGLEVTEGEIMKNPEEAIVILKQLHALGIKLAVDDFGTGYSSLSYLKRLPLDILKIDQSFVRGLPHHPKDVSIVRTVILLAENMGLETIAEGVETLEQKNCLIENGCRNIQGYYYARPMPSNEMEALLRASGNKI